MVENKKEEDDQHVVYDDDDQLVEKEECMKCSVVRFAEEQLELNIQLLIFKYLVWTKFFCSSFPQHTHSSSICKSSFTLKVFN